MALSQYGIRRNVILARFVQVYDREVRLASLDRHHGLYSNEVIPQESRVEIGGTVAVAPSVWCTLHANTEVASELQRSPYIIEC